MSVSANFLNNLKTNEGYRNDVYRDSLGVLTAGVGHKLTDEELGLYKEGDIIDDKLISQWLNKDSTKAYTAAKEQADQLGQGGNSNFIDALAEVNFQLGTNWYKDHHATWGLMQQGNFSGAAIEAADSDWNDQTPVRVQNFQMALQRLQANQPAPIEPPTAQTDPTPASVSTPQPTSIASLFASAGRETDAVAGAFTGERVEGLGTAQAPLGLGETFAEAVRAGGKQFESDVFTFGAIYNLLTGNEEAARVKLGKAKILDDSASEILSQMGTFEDFYEAPTFGKFIEQVVKGVGSFTPMAVTSLVSAGTGAVVANLGKASLTGVSRSYLKKKFNNIVKKQENGIKLTAAELEFVENGYQAARAARTYTSATATKVGLGVGAFGQEYVVGSSQALKEFDDAGFELTKEEAAMAAQLGIPQALLGTLSEGLFFRGMTKMALKDAVAGDMVAGTFMKELAKAVAIKSGQSFVVEGVTETLQEGALIAQRFAIDPDYSEQEAKMRAMEAGFVGAFAGGARAAPASVISKAYNLLATGREVEADTMSQEEAETINASRTQVEPDEDILAQVNDLIDSNSARNAVILEDTTAEQAEAFIIDDFVKQRSDTADGAQETDPQTLATLEVGDEIDVYNAKGEKYKAKVAAVSAKGSVRVINQEGKSVLLGGLSATTLNAANPNLLIVQSGPQFAKFRGRKIKDLTEVELVAFIKELENVLNDANPNEGVGVQAQINLNAVKIEQARRKNEVVNQSKPDAKYSEIPDLQVIEKDGTAVIVRAKDKDLIQFIEENGLTNETKQQILQFSQPQDPSHDLAVVVKDKNGNHVFTQSTNKAGKDVALKNANDLYQQEFNDDKVTISLMTKEDALKEKQARIKPKGPEKATVKDVVEDDDPTYETAGDETETDFGRTLAAAFEEGGNLTISPEVDMQVLAEPALTPSSYKNKTIGDQQRPSLEEKTNFLNSLDDDRERSFWTAYENGVQRIDDVPKGKLNEFTRLKNRDDKSNFILSRVPAVDKEGKPIKGQFAYSIIADLSQEEADFLRAVQRAKEASYRQQREEVNSSPEARAFTINGDSVDIITLINYAVYAADSSEVSSSLSPAERNRQGFKDLIGIAEQLNQPIEYKGKRVATMTPAELNAVKISSFKKQGDKFVINKAGSVEVGVPIRKEPVSNKTLNNEINKNINTIINTPDRGNAADNKYINYTRKTFEDEFKKARGFQGVVPLAKKGTTKKGETKTITKPFYYFVPKTQTTGPLNIWAGTNENAVLSNLAGRPFTDKNGRSYVSVEHAYQSWKSGEFDADTYNKGWAPGKKIIGRKGTKTEGNWNIQLMERMVRLSFEQNPEAQQALLNTGDATLTHTQDRGVWKNEFPRILMEVRDSLQPTQTTGPTQTTVVYKKGVEAVRQAEAAGEGINVLRKDGNKHYGNPFTMLKTPTRADVKVDKLEEAVSRYTSWLEGTSDTELQQERRQWILDQIDNGVLDNQNLLYFTNKKPNHAEALAAFAASRRKPTQTTQTTGPTKKVFLSERQYLKEFQDYLQDIANEEGIFIGIEDVTLNQETIVDEAGNEIDQMQAAAIKDEFGYEAHINALNAGSQRLGKTYLSTKKQQGVENKKTSATQRVKDYFKREDLFGPVAGAKGVSIVDILLNAINSKLKYGRTLRIISLDDEIVLGSEFNNVYVDDNGVSRSSKWIVENIKNNLRKTGKPAQIVQFGAQGDVIILNLQQKPTNEQFALMIRALGHEIGHGVYMQELERSLAIPSLRKKLDKAFAKARKALQEQGSTKYDGKFGFEEWYADQYAVYAFDPDQKATNFVQSYFKRIVQKLKAFFDIVNKQAKGRFTLDPDFASYMNKVIQIANISPPGNATFNSFSRAQKAEVYRVLDVMEQTVDTPKGVSKQALFFIKRQVEALLRAPLPLLPKDKKHVSLNYVFKTAHGYLKEISPALAAIMYSESQSEDKSGYINVRILIINQKLNEIYSLVPKKKNGEPNIEALTRIAEEAEASTPTAELSPDARKMREFLSEFYDTYIDGNLEGVLKLPDFFPRKWSLAELRQSPEKRAMMARLLRKYNPDVRQITDGQGTTYKNWESYVESWLETDEDNEAVAKTDNGLSTLSLGMNQARVKYFKKIPTEAARRGLNEQGEINPEGSKDIELLNPAAYSLKAYVEDTVKRVEYDKRARVTATEQDWLNIKDQLGEDAANIIVGPIDSESSKLAAFDEGPSLTKDLTGWKATEVLLSRIEDVNDRRGARRAMEAMLGRVGLGMSGWARQINSWGLLTNMVTLLTFTALASLPDLAGPTLRSKGMNNFGQTMNQIKYYFKNREAAEQFAKDLGVITHDALETMYINAAELGFMTKETKYLANKFFKVIGLDFFTKFTRVFAAGMGEQFLINLAKTNDANSNRYLRELGLTKEEVLAWSNKENKRDFSGPEGAKIKAAIGRFVEESIVRPSAAERPVWASNPYTALIWQLKSFFYAYGKNIIGGAIRETKNRFAKDGFVPGSVIPLILGAVTLLPLAAVGLEIREFIKYLARGGDASVFRSDNMPWGQYFLEILERAGVFGAYGLIYGMMQADNYGNSWFIEGLGPTAQRVEDLWHGNAKVDDYNPFSI